MRTFLKDAVDTGSPNRPVGNLRQYGTVYLRDLSRGRVSVSCSSSSVRNVLPLPQKTTWTFRGNRFKNILAV